MMENAKSFLTVLLVVVIWNLNSIAQANDSEFKIVDPNKIPEILSMIVSATQANFEKIKTWQGKITKETISTTKGEDAARLLKKFTSAEPNNSTNEIQRFYKRTIEFKINVEDDHFFSSSGRDDPYIYLDTKDNQSYSSSWGPEEQVFLVTSEEQIEIIPARQRKKDNAVLSRIAIKEPSGTTAITDPRKVFYTGGRLLWISLSMLSQNLQTPDIEHFGVVMKKQVAGDNITYRIEMSDPGKNRPFCIFTLSSEVGFNRTYFEEWNDEDGSLIAIITTDFVKLDGVFLPKKWSFFQYFPDGELMRQEINTIENQQINVTIPESTFSELTYLNSGDKFRDKVANKDFEYKNGELVELAKKTPNKQSSDANSNDPNQLPY